MSVRTTRRGSANCTSARRCNPRSLAPWSLKTHPSLLPQVPVVVPLRLGRQVPTDSHTERARHEFCDSGGVDESGRPE